MCSLDVAMEAAPMLKPYALRACIKKGVAFFLCPNQHLIGSQCQIVDALDRPRSATTSRSASPPRFP
jgi:hypothetical protein